MEQQHRLVSYQQVDNRMSAVLSSASGARDIAGLCDVLNSCYPSVALFSGSSFLTQDSLAEQDAERATDHCYYHDAYDDGDERQASTVSSSPLLDGMQLASLFAGSPVIRADFCSPAPF